MKQCEEPESIRVLVGMEGVGNKRLMQRESGSERADMLCQM